MSRQAAIELGADQANANRVFAPEPFLRAIRRDAGAAAVDPSELIMRPCPPASMWAGEWLPRRLLAVADVTVVAAALIAVLGRFGIDVALPAALVAVPMLLVLFKVTGLYNHDELRLRHSTLDEVPHLFQLTGMFSLGVAILLGLMADRALGATGLALLWAVLFTAVGAGRVGARGLVRRIVPAERCLIVGDVRNAQRIRQRIVASGARSEVVACVACEELDCSAGPEVMRDLTQDLGIQRIIIAPMLDGRDEGSIELLRMAKAIGLRVSVLPAILNAIGSTAAFDEVEGMGLLGVPRIDLERSSRIAKRALDLALTTMALVALAPLLIAIAIAIKLDSSGPILFRQTRVGRGGRHFSIVKFRSMVTDADSLKEELRALSIAGAGLFKVRDDPRVTRVGRFLRESSLDELPQLFNVLLGDMSLVGPRPLVIDEDAQIEGLDRSRLRLKPGMTGPWQLQRSRVPLRDMAEIDYLYASSWSLWLDVTIMLRTVQHVVRRGNL